MAQQYAEIKDKHKAFVETQHMFFVATAAPEGRVNLSPKGLDSLRIVNPNRVAWLSVTGSGNETAAHLLENDRMTLMFCAFEGKPLIMRLYGRAHAVYPNDETWEALRGLFPPLAGARQIYDMHVDMVQTSCGFAVPLYNFVEQRNLLTGWAESRGPEGVGEYQQQKNTLSLDGRPTGLPG
jgi:hypothetical protein